MKTIKIGIAPQAKIRERNLAVTKGELKPNPTDPKISFTSLSLPFQALNNKNEIQ